MRVLWLCNIMPPFVAKKLQIEGSVKEGWITGLLTRLMQVGKDCDMVLGIAFPTGENLKSFHDVYVYNGLTVECFGFHEDLNVPHIYQPQIERRLEDIVTQFKPDLVHIFGTEYPHTLAMSKVFLHPEKILVGIQGVISACAKEYLADLPREVVHGKTFRDLVKKDSILQQQSKFAARGKRETRALSKVGNVTGRTEFDREFCETIKESLCYYPMNETMRPCFYEEEWSVETCEKHRIFFSQADYPLKGFHYLLQAMPKILEKYPDAKIAVAGNDIIHKPGWLGFLKISAYGKYMAKLVRQNHLQEKIEFLGKLSAEEMKKQYLKSHVFVCASSLENSPNSVAEAMLLGTPVVAAKVGGVPSMVTDHKEGLLFEGGNVEGLTEAVLELWEDESVFPGAELELKDNESVLPGFKGKEGVRSLAERLSKAARLRAGKAHNPETNFARLLEIYREIEKK